jgi:hypothetical protein
VSEDICGVAERDNFTSIIRHKVPSASTAPDVSRDLPPRARARRQHRCRSLAGARWDVLLAAELSAVIRGKSGLCVARPVRLWRVNSCFRSPAPERSSDLKRYSPIFTKESMRWESDRNCGGFLNETMLKFDVTTR